MMNIKRAIGIIFLLSVAVHTSSIISSKLLGIDLETADATSMPLAMWAIALVSVSIISVSGALWFFNSPKTTPGAKNGFLFGLIADIFGFTVSALLLLRVDNGWSILQKYFYQPQFWLAFILILTTCTLVGFIKAKKKYSMH